MASASPSASHGKNKYNPDIASPTVKTYIPDANPTAIENTLAGQTQPATQKILRNGQLFILRGEKVYTLTGQEVK